VDPGSLIEVLWSAQLGSQNPKSVYNKKSNNYVKGESRRNKMADLNTVTITGRLTKDPELKSTTTGKNVVSFSVAVNGYKEGDTSFIDVTAWEKTAELVANHFSKGSRILLQGQLQQRTWDKDGQKHSKIEINAREIVFIDPKKQDSGSQDVVIDDIEDKPIDLSAIPF